MAIEVIDLTKEKPPRGVDRPDREIANVHVALNNTLKILEHRGTHPSSLCSGAVLFMNAVLLTMERRHADIALKVLRAGHKDVADVMDHMKELLLKLAEKS